MQTANIMLALGGNKNNTIPKYGVTAAEIAVLQVIHGNESVFDIDPSGDIVRNSREERERLQNTYGRNKEQNPVAALFPGVAARVFDNIDELGLPDIFFKATDRASPGAPAKPDVVGIADPVAAKPIEPAPAPIVKDPEPVKDPADEDFKDMPPVPAAPADGTSKLFG